jgi:hypothetical protein
VLFTLLSRRMALAFIVIQLLSVLARRCVLSCAYVSLAFAVQVCAV